MNHTLRSTSALTAVVFCGYLTIATSAPEGRPCPANHDVGQVGTTFDATGAKATSWWKLTGLTATPIVEWHVAVSQTATVAYVLKAGQPEIPVFQVEQPSTLAPSHDAGPLPETGVTPSKDKDLANFVEEYDRGLRVVCAEGAEWCREIHFAVTPSGNSQGSFELTATAFSAGCGADGPITELTLTPWQP